MLTRIIIALIAAALPATLLAEAKPPETLARSGTWIVDYDSDACHIVAEFGTGKEKVTMRMTRYDLGPEFKLSLYGDRFATTEVMGSAKLDFGLSRDPREARSMSGRAGDLRVILFSELRLDGWRSSSPEKTGPTITPEQEASVSGLTVRIPGKKPFRLEFGSLGRPLAQLRSCQADLVKSWGYDPAVQETLSRPVKQINDASDWLRSSDYPTDALWNGHNGTVQIRIDVDAAGKVAGCHVLNRSNPDVFADLTCRAVRKRARLLPAVDSAGQPVRSFAVFSVIWLVA